MSRGAALGFFLLIAVALALRCPQLDRRPLHNDEAVNAFKFESLWDRGNYKYDPNEYHGPALPYLTAGFAKMTRGPAFVDFEVWRFRGLTVLAGVALILLLPLLKDGLGQGTLFFAGLFFAISPAMVFYSRYYIHEMLLVLFSALAIGAGWRYLKTRKLGWALVLGASVGLMAATKETFVLSVAAAVGALFVNALLAKNWRELMNRKLVFDLALALLVFLVVMVLFFSSFFTNPSGILDSIRTYFPWLHRAGGASPHIHPWYFYFERLILFHQAPGPYWSEALILILAFAGLVAACKRAQIPGINPAFLRFLAVYTVLLALIYSAISYKTPWCLLNFYYGVILLAGVGTVWLERQIRSNRLKFVMLGLLVIGIGRLTAQSWLTSTVYSADRRNPYVYAQTSPDILRMVEKIEEISAASPGKRQMLIKVMSSDSYWPLPWYLRHYPRVGWFKELPSDPYAPVMIVEAKLQASLDAPKTHVMVGLFSLRPEVFMELYVERALWERYLATRPPSIGDED